jgi:aromatic-L-amino-acid/L-tryptophan decarboxylase
VTPEEFRTAGHQLVDWVAEYLQTVDQHPVASPVKPGEVTAQLPLHPPVLVEPWSNVMADLNNIVLPAVTHWQHPSFFAYFPSNSSYSSILGELASAGLGVNGMLWATSPAATELETVVVGWMAQLLGLPERLTGPEAGGVIQGTASEATLCAVLAARERVTSGASNRAGSPAGLVAYTTAQAHSSVEKALRVAGIGSEQLRVVDADASFAMRPDALGAAIAADRAAGRTPFFVVASIGTTSSMAVDPVPAIGEVCEREGVWLHVDAAMAGIAALCPEHRGLLAGLERVDSFCTNPHKWMSVNFDCDLFWVARRADLISALSILPEYLRTAASESGAVIDYRDWGIPLGRRFRALKLWFTLRLDGVESIQAMIRRHVEWAAWLADQVRADARFELTAPPNLNLVCLHHVDGNDTTDELVNAANATGEALFTRTVLDGRSSLRVCIGARTTERQHVEAAWNLLRRLAP